MPQFQYEVKKGPEEKLSGTLEADSQRAAVARLREMGYFPLNVERVQEDGGSKALVKRAFQRIRLSERNSRCPDSSQGAGLKPTHFE